MRGRVLMGGVSILALAGRVVVSRPLVFVLAGIALGHAGVNALSFDYRGPFVKDLAAAALIFLLVRAALDVPGRIARRSDHLRLSRLVWIPAITAVLIAAAGRVMLGLSWPEAFLLGVILAPIDSAASPSVATGPRLPRLVRRSLDFEAALGIGLALPVVVALTIDLRPDIGFVWSRFLLEEVGIGLACGVGVGIVAAWIMSSVCRLTDRTLDPHKPLYALGAGLLAYGIAAVLPHGRAATLPHGNGFIAVYVCVLTLTIFHHGIPGHHEHQSEHFAKLAKLMKAAVFVVFGSLLTRHRLTHADWAGIALVPATLLIARPAAVIVALARTRLPTVSKACTTWFGPRGAASMTLTLLVLNAPIPVSDNLFNLAGLVILALVIAQGLIDTAGSNITKRLSGAYKE